MNSFSAQDFAHDQLLPFLLNPKSYPHRPKHVRLVQTHASYVFLAPPFVYKVKKPVNFGFLDFSTLEKRRFFCHREVKLNRRLCPTVYLGVIPISMKQARLIFGEGDPIVEYAVKMRKLSERNFLDTRVERGEVSVRDLERVAQTLKKFYEAQKPTEEIEQWGRIDRLRISTDENFRQTAPFLGHTLSRAGFETIRFYTDEFYRRNAALFAARIQERRIRDCHGDLHLEHIHLTPRTLHIYDCIEFNDRLRYVDVASDVAFLAMDLDYQGRPDLARHFLSKMSNALRDRSMPNLMEFYKCYRAYVRGKVESLHSAATETPKRERELSAQRAHRYFRLALQYAVAGSQPVVLVVMGRVGSGKSTLAGALAGEVGWKVIASDRMRKKMAGLPLQKRSDRDTRARLYAPAMTEKIYQMLCRLAQECVRKQQSVILDATFGRRIHRDRVKELCGRLGVIHRFIEVHTSDTVVKQRLKERDSQANVVSDARLEDFDKLNRRYEAPSEVSFRELITANSARSPEATLLEVLKKLVQLQLETTP